MLNFVITGTSGVGKTFLEEELEKTGRFFQLPKYTDRPLRPGEDPLKLVSLSSEDFYNLKETRAFFFTLEYHGHCYGWKSSDLRINISNTLAVTLDSLKPFLSQNPNFIPVLLSVDGRHFSLLADRLKLRENYSLLSAQDQAVADQKVQERLVLARRELQQIDQHISLAKLHRGLVFNIQNDQTIFSEVIPKILSL
jgi:guanylate kinase